MRICLALILLLTFPLTGCPSASAPTPPAALAPGYLSPADQKLGQSLAALDAFVQQEKINYASLPSAGQAKEKSLLNALIAATNIANAAYTSYHSGTQTFAQAQSAYISAQSVQTQLVGVKEGN